MVAYFLQLGSGELSKHLIIAIPDGWHTNITVLQTPARRFLHPEWVAGVQQARAAPLCPANTYV
jgi:hypothetical protein